VVVLLLLLVLLLVLLLLLTRVLTGVLTLPPLPSSAPLLATSAGAGTRIACT